MAATKWGQLTSLNKDLHDDRCSEDVVRVRVGSLRRDLKVESRFVCGWMMEEDKAVWLVFKETEDLKCSKGRMTHSRVNRT